MEFVDNTGHIFSLPSYSEKPIGYEYDEYSYIFWIDSNNTSKLSVNNFYSRPIYALYELNKDFRIEDLENDYNSALDIEIYVDNSNVFKLISSKDFQHAINKNNFNLTDYVDLNNWEYNFEDNTVSYNEKYNFLKTKLTNEDLFCVKIKEIIPVKDDAGSVELDYLMIPIYPIAMSKKSGTWITNVMIHIHNNSNNTDEWCYISVGGEFVDEYEELIINGRNMGVSLPKDILKAIYSESLYNDEFNEALFNEKLKEYMLNYMNIHGEIGNFKSALDSLKWFGYGNKISVSKLLRTDNEFKHQYLLDYFDISNDIIESYKTFVTNSLISLIIYINKDTGEQYPFDFHGNDLNNSKLIANNVREFYGENKPKLISLIDNYEKIKIGNHDLPIENDNEKYWYWKPYFNFSFNELGIKLICLAYYYKKYFLPIHLNIHTASLGYKVYSNDIKLTNTVAISQAEPLIVLNNKDDVKFSNNSIYYFTKQIHYINEQFNEFDLGTNNIENDEREWYYLNDTCVNIPITFNNIGYYSCVLLLQKASNNEVIYESHFNFYQAENFKYKNFIIYPKKLNITINDHNVVSNYFEYWINKDFIIKLLVNNKWYEHDFTLKINNPTIEYGTLKYRYYLNDHNYLFYKILNDNNTNLHNILFCDYNDNYKVQNATIENLDITDLYNVIVFNAHSDNIYVNDNPDEYTLKVINYNENLNNINASIIWENNIEDNIEDNKECYVYYHHNIDDNNITIAHNSNITIYNEKIFNIDIELNDSENIVIIYPESWGELKLFKNDLKYINQYIYDKLNINTDISWLESFNVSEMDYAYQFFKQHYDLLSPFKQIKKINDNNKQIIFNAYMHNKQLVDTNEINFDINLHTILKYHLEHNLLYIDGTLLNGEFYQYIIFTDALGKDHEIYLHKDLIGEDIDFDISNLNNNENILICAYQGYTYILAEHYNAGNSNYIILNNNDNILFSTEDNESILIYDIISFKYDKKRNIYYQPDPNDPTADYDPTNENQVAYEIYDKLFANTEVINSKYNSIVNLPNDLKYQNSIHLFGIYNKHEEYKNILVFHKNIDMFIDGLRFIHGITYDLNNDDDLKIFLEGQITTDIDTRYPDTYGLFYGNTDNYTKPYLPSEFSDNIENYLINIGTEEQPEMIFDLINVNINININSNDDLSEEQLNYLKQQINQLNINANINLLNNKLSYINIDIDDNYNLSEDQLSYLNQQIESLIEQIKQKQLFIKSKFGFYVKRNYDDYYNDIKDIWELDNLYEYDVNEYDYYKENQTVYVGNAIYNSIDDFKSNNIYQQSFADIYEDNHQYKIEIKQETTADNKHIYYFEDKYIKDINDYSKPYKNILSYKVKFLDEYNNAIYLSKDDTDNINNYKMSVSFYYSPVHITRNRYYTLKDYIKYLSDNNIQFDDNQIYITSDKQKFVITIEDIEYEINLIDSKFNYIYTDEEYGNIITNQNPSMYWYNDNADSIETLGAYLNEIERYIIKDESIDSIKDRLDKYIELYDHNRYVDDMNTVLYSYKNYLVKDITGLEGTYIMSLLTNIENNDKIRMCIEVIDKDENITLYTKIGNNNDNIFDSIKVIDKNENTTIYTKNENTWNIIVIDKDKQETTYTQDINNSIFNNDHITFDKTESKITVFIQMMSDLSEDEFLYNENEINDINNKYFIPKLEKIITIEERLKYIPEESTSLINSEPNLIKLNYLNREFNYGDNNNKFVYNLYNDFFKLKFNVYDIYFNVNSLNKTTMDSKLLHSVYDIDDSLKLNTYLNYDFYLMHDNEYWYGLYISQETCDHIRDHKDLKLLNNDYKKYLNGVSGNQYILNYERSSEEYLINRLEFNSSEGYNQFNNDDIVCCYLYNNDRLPFNGSISSKWKIEPMSLGMSLGKQFDSNGEMTIISLPKNNSKYETGYYKITVKYSLDRDIQHQFKHTSTIRIS